MPLGTETQTTATPPMIISSVEMLSPTIAPDSNGPTTVDIEHTETSPAGFPVGIAPNSDPPTLPDIIKGHCFYPSVVKDGLKVVSLNHSTVKEHCKKWQNTLIGYVLGGNPTFKEMLKFMYGVWRDVTAPTAVISTANPKEVNTSQDIGQQQPTRKEVNSEDNNVIPLPEKAAIHGTTI
ncbi:hypothetical protein RND71_025098 [Anisodus tanguticus]|uniref:Uncharacterized protein n=1 Tax=Anisodus tanguticus TaxID=243964 RepID=A0AAE1RRM2_9SOLA|nr:hypothetical protein RND71_025098 [Anisodus tanguticus]